MSELQVTENKVSDTGLSTLCSDVRTRSLVGHVCQ